MDVLIDLIILAVIQLFGWDKEGEDKNVTFIPFDTYLHDGEGGDADYYPTSDIEFKDEI